MKFLGRFPVPMSIFIIACFATALWAVTHYFESTIRPLQEQARRAHIEGEIKAADSLLQRKRYDTAAQEYRFILDAYGSELLEQDKGHLQDGMGRSHFGLSTRQDQEKNLNLAIENFQEALLYRTPDLSPKLYSATWKRLGQTYETLGVHLESEDDLATAIEAYQKALSLQAADTDPEGYAMTKALVGGAYRELYAFSREKQHSALAFETFEEAIDVLNRDDHPEALGLVRVEIGRTYVTLAKYSRRTGNSQNALKEYERALKLLKPETFPTQYARAHKYIGDAYTMLTQTKPRNRQDVPEHAQRVYRWERKANDAYKIAQNFGFNDDMRVTSTSNSSSNASTMEADKADDKK